VKGRKRLYDADGTLFDFDRAESAALRHVFKFIGTAFDPVDLSSTDKLTRSYGNGSKRER